VEGVVDAGWWGDGIQGGAWGLLDGEGNLVKAPEFGDYKPFSDGVAWVNQGGKRDEPSLVDPYPDCMGGTWGLINTRGELLLDFKYEEVYPFKDGKALIKQDGRWCFIGKKGDIILHLDPRYESVMSVSKGLIQVVVEGKQGFINDQGEILLEPSVDDVILNDECVWVKKEQGWCIFNEKSGEVLVPEVQVDKIRFSSGKYSIITVDNKEGIMNEEGHVIVEPRFTSVTPFRDGSSWVYEGGYVAGWSGIRGGKWGLINDKNEFLVEPRFDRVYDFMGPLSQVELEGSDDASPRWGYYNSKGKQVWMSKS
ncbi:hypothetical protein GF325_12995, partial [Candidatus Bathyarchaeota archaeon]|nr:hypothetical protein [Candidatus Bathyarchaeota archaeon]